MIDARMIQEESADDLYEHAPCGYVSTLEDGTIVRANETFLRWIGYERDAVQGRLRLQDLLAPGARIYHETHVRPLLAMQGFAREIAVDVVHAKGHRLPALLTASVVRRDGAPMLVRTMFFDATERRGYEQELLRERTNARESEARARELARTLQESLIPPEPPAIPGIEVAAMYRPAGDGDTVGGDFYDVFETGRGDWAVVVGDVMGKGAEAARVTAAARYTLRAAAMHSNRPQVILGMVNDALISQGSTRFCTAAYARLSISDDDLQMTVCCAGHPLPISVPAGGAPRTVGRPGALLGAFPHTELRDVTVAVSRGETIVFYTDGFTEARAPDGRFLGDEGLMRLVATYASRPVEDLARRLVDDVVAFQDDAVRDDMALVVVRLPPA